MAERTYKRPREFFGVSAQPLPGSENPMLSWDMNQRFNQAGLGSFVPYANPWETVARSRQYRDMERDFRLQDQIEDAEMGFMEAIRQEPKTGYQKFLQQNPLATLSPMVRAYVSTQGRIGGGSSREEDLAKLGAPYLKTYRDAVRGGMDDLEAFAQAVSQREKDVLESKRKPSEDTRLWFTEKGGDLEKFNELSQRFGDDRAAYQDYLNKQPKKKTPLQASERGKLNEALTAYNAALAEMDAIDKDATGQRKIDAFKAAHNREPQTAKDWQDAYYLVKEQTVAEPRAQLQQLTELYEDREIPEAVNRALGAKTTAPAISIPASLAPTQTAPVPTSPVPPAPVLPAPSPTPVSPADLKREDAPVSFESLQQEMVSKGEAKRREREEAQRRKAEAEQMEIDISVPRWETAKQQLLQGFRPEFAKFQGDPEIKTMLASMGKKANEKAFDDGSGRPVSWLEVGRALLSDPRIKSLQTGEAPASTSPISTQQQQNLPVVENAQQFATIKSGEWFIDGSGIPKKKK